MDYATNFQEQRDATNAWSIAGNSKFYELLYELHDFSIADTDGEPHYTFPEDFDASVDDHHANIQLYFKVTLLSTGQFESQLTTNKTAALADIDRVEDIWTRWSVMGSDRPWSSAANSEAYFRDNIWLESDSATAEANLAAMEVERSDYNASPDRTTEAYKSAVVGAMAFGQDLMADYGVKNLTRGYSEAQIKQLTLDLKDIMGLLVGGALNTARTEIFNFTPTAEVIQADIDEFVAKIDSYLA